MAGKQDESGALEGDDSGQTLWGTTVTNDDAPPGESFEERMETLNSNLRRLIAAIGGLLAGSGELLARLQQRLGVAEPAAGGSEQDLDHGTVPPGDGDRR
jgi:hypothetical protein